jgi:hypothetical protein
MVVNGDSQVLSSPDADGGKHRYPALLEFGPGPLVEIFEASSEWPGRKYRKLTTFSEIGQRLPEFRSGLYQESQLVRCLLFTKSQVPAMNRIFLFSWSFADTGNYC